MAAMSDMPRSSKATFGVAVVLLLLALQAVQSRALGLDDSRYWERMAATKTPEGSAKWAKKTNTFQLDLIHFTQFVKNLSLAERVQLEVNRSLERSKALHQFHPEARAGPGRDHDDTFSSPVYSAQGSYLMQIRIGTPARTFVAIADTGSDLVWVQGVPCSECFSQPDPYFDPSQSSSYATAACGSSALCSDLPSQTCSPNCQYSYGYGDQSTTRGDFSTDTVTLIASDGSSQSFPDFGFGVGHENQGTFTNTDGLVGLGQGPLSLVSQLGSHFDHIFSYCLVNFYSASSVTSPLLLGSAGAADVAYTPLVGNSANPSFYYITVVGIAVAGTPLSYPAGTFDIDSSGGGGFIVDSGTTITQLPQAAYTPLLNAMKAAVAYPTAAAADTGFDLCYDLSAAPASPAFPTVTFSFQNVDVELPSNNVFLQVDDAGTYCLAFQGSGLGFGIFGNVQQQDFRVAFDRANRRVGFAPQQC